MRLPHRSTSVPAHPPAPPLRPGGVNQYPQLFIPPDVQSTTPTRQQQRGRSRNPRRTPNDIVMHPHQDPQLEDMTRSRSRRRNSQPVQIIDRQPNQDSQLEQMLRSRSVGATQTQRERRLLISRCADSGLVFCRRQVHPRLALINKGRNQS